MEWLITNISLLLIPLVSAVVGWFTNFIAIKMMFYPIKFIGFFPPYIGWQGLIPSKSIEMAEISVDLLLGKMLSVEEMAEKIDHVQLTNLTQRRIQQSIRKLVNDTMEKTYPKKWASLPHYAKQAVYTRIDHKVPNIIEQLVDDFQYSIKEIFDIKELVVNYLKAHPALLNEMFLTAGNQEFKFVIKSGLYFGFLLGIPTLILWSYFQHWWILPLGGALVGYLTNWIALKIIFEPKNPIYVGPFRFQGLFLKRQQEVAVVYSALIQEKLLNAENIVESIYSGAGRRRLKELIDFHVDKAIEELISPSQPYIVMTLGHDDYQAAKTNIADSIFKEAPRFLKYANSYTDKALGLQSDLETKMKALSPEEFEGVLRPAYQKDEWKLIALGCFLGFLAGLFNLLYFLAKS